MKKVMLLFVLFLSVALTGCGAKVVNYEAVMKKYADEYFKEYAEPYLKTTNADGDEVFMMDIFEVSIANIKNVNTVAGGNFDLVPLKNCSDDSKVDLLIDRETSTVTKYEYYLECK